MKTTFQKVVRKALRDKSFLKALLKNPKKALQVRRMALPKADMGRLTRLLKKRYSFTGKTFLKGLAGIVISPIPWPKEFRRFLR